MGEREEVDERGRTVTMIKVYLHVKAQAQKLVAMG